MNNTLPSIPEYFKKFVDPKVDLDKYPQIPCPFHDEKKGRSFSYSREKKVWRCFGQCHCGGDVIALHQLNHRLKSREEAKLSLYSIYGVKVQQGIEFQKKTYEIDEKSVHRKRVYSIALSLAKDVESWLELDYILSKVPYDVKELEAFCSARGHTFGD